MNSPRTLLFLVTLLVTLTAVGHLPATAVGSTASPGHTPTWWWKYQALSSNIQATSQPSTGVTGNSIGPNIDVSKEPGPQSETAIAVNPDNPSQIVAGSNEIFRLPMRGYFSSDAGASWTGVDLPLPPPLVNNGFDFGSDPGVAWDTRGNVYYSYIVVFFSKAFAVSRNSVAIDGTEMAVARSSDGGLTWASTYFALQTGESSFNDKPMITVDTNPASPLLNTIYVAWDAAVGSMGIQVSRSTDGGQTFSAPVSAGPPFGIGADPFVGPDSSLYVAWHDVTNTRIAVSRSIDSGRTFGPVTIIAPTRVAFDVAIPAMNTRRALVYPACGGDLSPGPNRGTLYCSWMDETATDGADIFTSRSTDRGSTWSPPLRVNDDRRGIPNDQFNQWLAIDQSDGSVNLSWDDTRNDPTHVSTDIFYTRSTDGGQTFTKNLQVTTAPTNETCCGADLGNQYGDYEGIAALGGSVHPVWTDRRASVASLDEEVFTATITIK